MHKMKDKIKYPETLKDIPKWRQREIEENIRWFLRFTPTQRLEYIDREWEETQKFIEKYSIVNKWKAKKK